MGCEIHAPYCAIAAQRLAQNVFDFSELEACWLMATTLDDATDVAVRGILAGYNLAPLSALYNPRTCPARFLPFLVHYYEART